MTLRVVARTGLVIAAGAALMLPVVLAPGCLPAAPVDDTGPRVITGTGTGAGTGGDGTTPPVVADPTINLGYDAQKVNNVLAELVNPDLSGYRFTVFIALQNNTTADIAFTVESDVGVDVVVEVEGEPVTSVGGGFKRPILGPGEQVVIWVAADPAKDTCPVFLNMTDFVSALGRLIADINLVRGRVTAIERFDSQGNRQNSSYSCPGQLVFAINEDSVFATGLDISPIADVSELPATGLEFDVTPLPYDRELLIEALQEYINNSTPVVLDSEGQPDPDNDPDYLREYNFNLMFAFQSASLSDAKFDLFVNDEFVHRYFVKSRGGQVLVPISLDEECPERVEFRNFVSSDDHLIPDMLLVRWDREPTGLLRCAPQNVTDLRPVTCPPFPVVLTPRYTCKAIVLFVIKDTVVHGIELDRESIEVNEPDDPTDDDGG